MERKKGFARSRIPPVVLVLKSQTGSRTSEVARRHTVIPSRAACDAIALRRRRDGRGISPLPFGFLKRESVDRGERGSSSASREFHRRDPSTVCAARDDVRARVAFHQSPACVRRYQSTNFGKPTASGVVGL